MNRIEIDCQQQQILDSVARDKYFLLEKATGAIEQILRYDRDTIMLALGEFGIKLREFSECVDLYHPGLHTAFGGHLERGAVSDKLCQLLCLAEFAKKNNFSLALEGVPKVVYSDLPESIRRLDVPARNQRYVRLLSERGDRESVRNTKKMQQIDLRIFYSKGRSSWGAVPDDFAMSVRHNTAYNIEVEKAEKKAARFKVLGCEEMYKKIMDVVDVFKREMQEMYYGFHRVTMTRAAIILAKMHGCTLGDYLQIGSDGFLPTCIDVGHTEILRYAARAYPYKEFTPSSSVGQLVERLESFDTGKPIFDHYVLVVPSVERSKEMDLDHFLVETKMVIPALLGEADGKCYFICYWM